MLSCIYLSDAKRMTELPENDNGPQSACAMLRASHFHPLAGRGDGDALAAVSLFLLGYNARPSRLSRERI